MNSMTFGNMIHPSHSQKTVALEERTGLLFENFSLQQQRFFVGGSEKQARVTDE